MKIRFVKVSINFEELKKKKKGNANNWVSIEFGFQTSKIIDKLTTGSEIDNKKKKIPL